MSFRSEHKGVEGNNVILLLSEYGIKSHPVSKFIEKATELNTTFVFFEDNSDNLPLYCSNIIRLLDGEKGVIFDSSNKRKNQMFTYKTISDQKLISVLEKMSPIYCEEISLDSSLKKNISLFELLGIDNINEINLEKQWADSKIFESMSVPLGINVKNEIVDLNLHEKFHGPHGLVAGTTGSGKSEILQSYILSAALLFHPYEIGFVIIDFKGGGMVNQFINLPHLIGAITNIDGKQIDRSLKSIKAELLKRQTLFAEIEVNHIDKYIKAYKEGKAKIALPHLVIIVDEFAELKAEQPEFMKELISAARIGRSLGVHLILATQKPAGQVNEQIWSNSKFKLCLKVQNKEDSNEVLKSPLAAEIREPGRAYLQVGNNEKFELFQSAYSGGPAENNSAEVKNIELYSVDFSGKRELVYKQKCEANSYSKNQLDVIVEYIEDYCNRVGIEKLQEICLPALPEIINYDNKSSKTNDLKVALGIYDDPDNQTQNKAYISLGTNNTLIIGATQSGKTNLLQLIIRSLSETYTPSEVNIYILDFGSMILKSFEQLAHIGGIICPSDDEKIKNFFKFLNEQIVIRREKMISVGVSSFTAYKEAGYTDMPNIVVIVDNMTVLKELYLQNNDEMIGLCRDGIAAGITFVLANGQTNGFGYKYLTNFSTRIALFCNDKSEYVNLFGSAKIKPDEIVGRCIVEMDKHVYDCQSYLSFEGEKEIDRTLSIKQFIDDVNKKSDRRAIKIPEIPTVLYDNDLIDSINYVSGEIPLGLNYDNISLVKMICSRNNIISLCGEQGTGKTNFIKCLINYYSIKESCTRVFIVDDFKKKLTMEDSNLNVSYTINSEEGIGYISEVHTNLVEKYNSLSTQSGVNTTWDILVINNVQLIEQLSKDKDMLSEFKEITGKYKALNCLVVIDNIPNEKIASFGAMEVYKMIKESKNLLFFGDLDTCNVMDIQLQATRKYSKKIVLGDAYLFTQGDVVKVKLPKRREGSNEFSDI